MKNDLVLNSSMGVASFNNASNFLALAHSNNTDQFIPTNHYEFQPKIKSPMYVLGEQLASLAEKVCNVASYIYSSLPSFSLPGAAASTLSDRAPPVCIAPIGSYEESCHRPEVKYIAEEGKCELTTRCATMYEGLPHQKTSIRYSPHDSNLVVENNNGTLKIRGSREATINARFVEISETATTSEALLRDQEAVIGTLKAGDVITVNSELQPTVVSPEKWTKNNPVFDTFQRIAQATGGIMGHSSSSQSLNPLLGKMAAHILKTAESSEFLDIAFVLDTTSSMRPHIAQVQKNLVQFLHDLQEKKQKEVNSCRVALLEYRDGSDVFLNKVNTGLTSNLDQVQTAVKSLDASGGGDIPEAVFDALLVAKNDLSWHPKAKRIVILIGDAPPHPKTVDGRYDEKAVLAQYQTMGTEIAVYPVLSEGE